LDYHPGIVKNTYFYIYSIQRGKFPIGVAKYLSWPETTWSTRVTCTHHLWTIPLLLTACGGAVPTSSLYLSFVLMVFNVSMSRLLTPSEIHVPARRGNKKQSKYLNVNLSHELWKDIKLHFLQISLDDPPTFLYLFRLLWRWQTFNTMVYVTLVLLCKIIFAGDNHICKPYENS
jgi:hypothetical protein